MRYALLQSQWLSCHDDQKAVVHRYADDVTNYILRTIPPGEDFCIREQRILHAPPLIHLQESTRATYISLILHNHAAAFPHDSGAIIRTSRKRGRHHLWMIPPHPPVGTSAAEYATTFLHVADAIGRDPQPWEMDRINCPKAGTIGHYACGWCTFHRQPILVCGCRYREE